MNGFKDIFATIIEFLLQLGDSNIHTAIDVLALDLATGAFAMMHGAVTAIQSVIKPVALTICAVCFLMQVIKLTSSGQAVRWETGAKLIFAVIMARVAMDVCGYLMTAIYSTAAGWMTSAWASASTTSYVLSAQAADIRNTLEALSWGRAIGMAIFMVIPSLGVVGVTLYVVIMSYARMFELYFWIAVSPIACAFVPLEDNRIFKQFLFRYAGVALSGLAIIICVLLYNMFSANIISDLLADAVNSGGDTSVLSAAFTMLLGVVLLGLTVSKSAQWSKSLMDAA